MSYTWIYLTLKTFHIVFVVSWFACLFYLPRIFVNLAQYKPSSESYQVLIGMAQRLQKFSYKIATVAIILGLWLMIQFHIGHGQVWIHLKLLLVIGLIAYQFWCAKILKRFSQAQDTNTSTYYRWFNEIPLLFLILIVALVVIKPF